jgi:hypothetical protein
MPMSQPVPVFLRVTTWHCEIKLTLRPPEIDAVDEMRQSFKVVS